MAIESELSVPKVSRDFSSYIMAGSTVIRTVIGEQTRGKEAKRELQQDLTRVLSSPQFLGGLNEPGTTGVFEEKLLEFRLRMQGALSLYSSLSGTPYNQIREQGGIESFYMFWMLGAGQDDIIDSLHDVPEDPSEKTTPATIRKEIFTPKFYRGSLHLLERQIKDSSLGQPEQTYLRMSIATWYRHLVDQESSVRNLSRDEFTFDFSRKYREDQNTRAGRVLVALLNWDKCLDSNMQQLEFVIPRFSFLTQMIDDIGDTPEDIIAGRPSYSVGALVDHPEELQRFEREVVQKGIIKIKPDVLRRLSPNAHAQVQETFVEYARQLQAEGGRGVTALVDLVKIIHAYFPHVRDLFYGIHPKIVNL